MFSHLTALPLCNEIPRFFFHGLPYLAWAMKLPQHHLDAEKKINSSEKT
jgi:hypothetical protein